MPTPASDIQFAEASGDFTSRAPLLRYVAAINPEATVSEFVAAAEFVGYNPNTAANLTVTTTQPN